MQKAMQKAMVVVETMEVVEATEVLKATVVEAAWGMSI